MTRFDYIRYDEYHAKIQSDFKKMFESVESAIDSFKDGRAKSLALTKLEECYMWIGKAIRDQQVAETGISEEVRKRG